MANKEQNEKKFETWTDTKNGGRIYALTVQGKKGWFALYIKETDKHENTISFRQEIYNENGILKEIHEKYPIDKGHKKI